MNLINIQVNFYELYLNYITDKNLKIVILFAFEKQSQ